jgi:dTDP-4-dehydrorhamnose 3,5-epimerase-like enzyme
MLGWLVSSVPAYERIIARNDSYLAIDWPCRDAPVLSASDAHATPFATAETDP